MRSLVAAFGVLAPMCALSFATSFATSCNPAGTCYGNGDDGEGFSENALAPGGCTGSGGFAPTPPPGVSSSAPCSTGAWWQRGNEGSESMHPGVDCISCHAGGEGPNYTVAGTVMGASKDADDCQGISSVTVDITDANGQVHSFTTDTAGNFFFDGSIPTPYTVQLTHNGKTAKMLTPQTSGSCLSCHTSAGKNGAPGRIVAP